MCRHAAFARLLGALAVALLAPSCRDAVDPGSEGLLAPDFSITTGNPPALDEFNGTLSESGSRLAKGFDPTNPHLGSAIIATFCWLGSTNIVTEVSDHLADGTPVGNVYHLVEYVTDGGISMATYVATNVQNFPDPNPIPEQILVVKATLSEPITDGGVILSAYSGVESVYEQALATHRSATGTGSSTTTAGPGAIAAGAGALVYGVTLSNGVTGITGPPDFNNLGAMSDASMKGDAEYAVQSSPDSADPQWTWFFNSQSTWLATALTLNRSPGQSLTLEGTLNESGSVLSQGFIPTNPHLGDAIIATFFWLGSTNVITAVTDQLSDGTPVGNTYHLVEYVTAGGISMATYVATNVRDFPDPNTGSEQVLVVEANLASPVTDGGVMLSAFSGVRHGYAQALGAHQSASGSGSSPTTAQPGGIAVAARALVYAVAMSNGVVGIDTPTDFANITTMSDEWIKSDGEYAIRTNAGTVDPQWTWYFGASSTWLTTVLSLNAQ
jgi:hypothetical protein